ncbi:two-component regulator propeller domain-containing protein [Chitinophaga sp. SYP-B3965]|uniref:ligand-binding sensor domain-containing protein n=1 Tax=Chitinophaga sp. SYP-B3965 TaxID=2663120 RepID=UPI001566E936|nr:two-component regulator propeller domain-containing protein [Chitinophaga sp. SYP-B3965]
MNVLLLTGILQLSFIGAAAQAGYQFENLTEAHGLSDNRITCFLKDSTGFMWIGTENGLNRFDGHSFVVYKHGLSNPFINDIEQDAGGRLWVATQNGLNVITPGKDSNIVFMPQTGNSIPSDLIWDTYIDKYNRVWIAADVKDLCYYDISRQEFVLLPWKKYIADQFPHRNKKYNSIRKIYYKSDNELWLGTSAGLFSYTISTGVFTYHKSYEADHFIQLETYGNLFYFIQNPVNVLQISTRKDIPWSAIPSTLQGVYQSADAQHERWLPAGKDVVQVNVSTGETMLIKHRPDDPYSLPDGIVRTIYREPSGLVWVGTSKGIGKFNPAMNLFPFTEILPAFKRDPSPENDLYRIDHAIHTVFHSKGEYYISSPVTNSLLIRDSSSGKTRRITHIQGIPLDHCSVIFEDSKKVLWILAGTHAFCYDRNTRQFSVSPFRAQTKNLLFTDMAEDGDGNLWFACFNDGLYCYDVKTQRSRKFSPADRFSSTLPTSLYFDKAANKLWIGTFERSLYAYDFSSKQMKHSGIEAALINDITKDKKGAIWLATYAGGIVRFADTVTRITTREGLPENNIYSIQTDLDGNIWASSFKGLTLISPEGKVIENFNRVKGLNFSDLYSPLTLTQTGEILTGADNGFIRFHPDSLQYVSSAFPVVITSTTPYTDNEATFDFAALSYLNPSLTRYEYKMEGVDKDWVSAGYMHTTKYNNLAPGSYAFKVRAIDFTGKLSANEASSSFRIPAPWWQTGWFRILAVLLVVGIVFFLFRRRIHTIKSKALIRQQMAELKGQALRAQMNPHFIFNCLNAIQELIITEDYTASYKYLSKFSKLLRMVLNMSEKNMIPLSSEIEMCQLYLELESLRFKNSFQYTIKADERIDTDSTLFPSLLVQPFIENAIWHGLLQKEGEKRLSIIFEEEHGRLICLVKDNGIGRERAIAIKAQKIGAMYVDPKGIALARQRIENLQAAFLEIIDCKEPTGTIVRIVIASPENTEI